MARSHDGFRYRDGKYYAWRKITNGEVKVIKATTHKLREERIRAFKAKLAAGPVQDPESVRTFFNNWLEETIRPNRAYQTGQGYGYMISLYIEPSIGDRLMSSVAPDDLQRLLNGLTAKGVAPRTVKKCLNVLNLGFKMAQQRGVIKVSPSVSLSTPPSPEGKKRILKIEEAKALIAYRKTRYSPLFAFLLTTGLRISEALGLRPEDITPERVLVNHQLSWRTGGDYSLEALKTKASKRGVPLSVISRDALIRVNEQRDRDQILAQDGWENCGLLFTTESGSPMAPSNVYRALAAALVALKIPPATVHDLRRTFISQLARNEARPQVVKAIAGHSNIQTTMQYYVVSDTTDEADAMERTNKWLD